MTMILLLAYPNRGQVPGHDAHEDRLLIQQAHRVLSQWKVVPFVNPPLAKLKEIMAAKEVSWPLMFADWCIRHGLPWSG